MVNAEQASVDISTGMFMDWCGCSVYTVEFGQPELLVAIKIRPQLLKFRVNQTPNCWKLCLELKNTSGLYKYSIMGLRNIQIQLY